MLLLMSDEAHFYLDNFMNKQNCCYYAAVNPRNLYEWPLYSSKVSVWCAVSKKFFIGPYFFEEQGNIVTVNSVRYIDMLNNFLKPKLRRRQTINVFDVWFQQGTSSYYYRYNECCTLDVSWLPHLTFWGYALAP